MDPDFERECEEQKRIQWGARGLPNIPTDPESRIDYPTADCWLDDYYLRGIVKAPSPSFNDQKVRFVDKDKVEEQMEQMLKLMEIFTSTVQMLAAGQNHINNAIGAANAMNRRYSPQTKKGIKGTDL